MHLKLDVAQKFHAQFLRFRPSGELLEWQNLEEGTFCLVKGLAGTSRQQRHDKLQLSQRSTTHSENNSVDKRPGGSSRLLFSASWAVTPKQTRLTPPCRSQKKSS